ncbi:DUF4097 domain-containing protein [Flagellimonas sp. HMM57]|uniref:DUF4097 family beta strand repeat-containing protein n=1 Tax=unclassified Flagellimonas TaxID=2644544 RepID=UPI0013D32696|nr:MULTISPECIES: DUF4097 family beta strand repeat-containing protein [unclassified Flagellimonas]UII77017.1 DUF4097 domain-containing protein [Flagellimonas sp. HMM57]
MKQLILMVFLISFLGMQSCNAQQKKHEEQIKKEVPLSNNTKNRLVIKNVFGSIAVEGYSGNEVLVDVEKIVSADNAIDLELGKKELTLKIVQEENLVILHPDAPYIEFDKENLRYNWCNKNEEPPYQHKLNFKIKVPKSIQIDVSTVNDGEVLVENTRGNSVKAENINGGIALTNITGKTDVNCINGPVNISYADNPKSSSKYYALNGDINISYQKALSATISFKSMNGELFTDFDINKQFIETNRGTGDRGKYKYEAKPVVQIGSGQVDFDFETLNGNVFIKKI